MEFGENGAVISNTASASPPPTRHPEGSLRGAGFNTRPNRYIRRNKLACFVSSLIAILFVALVALFFFWVLNLSFMIWNDGAPGSLDAAISKTAFGRGAMLAIIVSLYNWFLFFIVLPITWFVVSQTVGRLAHRGVTRKWVYLRWSALCGAGLVSLGTTIPAFISSEGTLSDTRSLAIPSEYIATLSGSLLTGTLIGSVAGVFTGMIFLLIVRPAAQLSSQNIHTADVF